MSALAEALVAAQRRALTAMEKRYAAGGTMVRQRAKRNGYDAPLALVTKQSYIVTLEVRGRAVVSVQADTPDEACTKAAQLDPWDFDVDVTDTTVEGWELDAE